METLHLNGSQTLAQLSQLVRPSPKPLRVTGEDCGDLVVMSGEIYEKFLRELVVWSKLREAEIEEQYNPDTCTLEEVYNSMMDVIGGGTVA